MARYVMLLKFTAEGLATIQDSPVRKESFAAAVATSGGQVEQVYWTLGEYDAVAIFTAPDEATATVLTLELTKLGNVRANLLRAFDDEEFKSILDRLL
jgi:uncharacterized protein with GYD domain